MRSYHVQFMSRGLVLISILLAVASVGCQGVGAPTWNNTGFNAPAWNMPNSMASWNPNPSLAATPPAAPLGTGLIPPPATGSYIPSPIAPTSLAGPPAGFGFNYNPAAVPGYNVPSVNSAPGFSPPAIDPTGMVSNSPQVSPYWNAAANNSLANNGFNPTNNGWNMPAGGYPMSPAPYSSFNNGYNPAANNNPLIAWGDRLRGAITQTPGNWLANNGGQPSPTQGWSFPQGANPPVAYQPTAPGFNSGSAPPVGWNGRSASPTAMTTRQPSGDNYAPEPPVRIPDAALAGDVTPPRRPSPPPPTIAAAPRQPTPPLVYPTGNGQGLAPTNVAGNRQTDWIEITQLPKRQR